MKKLILLFIAVSPIAVATARQSNSDKPYLTKTFSSSAIKSLRSETSGGSLTVTGTNAGEAKVEVYIRPNGNNKDISDEEIKSRLSEDYTIDVSLDGTELKAVARSKGNINWKKALSISFKISVPTNISSTLATSGGSISLANLKGNQDFRTSGGSLRMDGLDGIISGRTSGGSINVNNSKGTLDLKTSGGSIQAINCNGKINLATSGGSLKLQQLKGDIEAKTSGGSIKGDDISGSLYSHTSGGSIHFEQLACSLDAGTSAGSVYASFTETGKSVRINVSAGSATIALPKNKGYDLDLNGGRINAGPLSNFNGSMEKDHVIGSLNGGGSEVYVRTSAGSVSIDWK